MGKTKTAAALSDYSKEELLKMAMRMRTDPGISMSVAEAKDYWFRLGFMQGLSAGTKLSLLNQEEDNDN